MNQRLVIEFVWEDSEYLFIAYLYRFDNNIKVTLKKVCAKMFLLLFNVFLSNFNAHLHIFLCK